MILYYTGTGNSAYAARQIAARVGDEVLDLLEKLRGGDHTPLHSERPWVVVTPTYAWQMPRLVRDWLRQTPLTGCREIYFVLTCGSSIGGAGVFLKDLCRELGLEFRGCAPVIMPENYIAMFKAPDPEESRRIIAAARDSIDAAADAVAAGRPFPERAGGKLRSSLVNGIFYRFFLKAKKFYATDACTGCGSCAAGCPMNNIHMADGRPVWGDTCTHCMACICACPAGAVEYGGKTRNKVRYLCPGDV